MSDPIELETQAPDARATLPEGYRLERELGSGSQGRVYLARRADDTRVVLRITASAAGEAERLAELAVLASVEHPGLAQLVDHGVTGAGESYVARTWIEGPDLSAYAVAKRAEHDLEAIGRVVARMCFALEELHRRGFVHADLKPSNVIVTDGERPVITDFGLARASERAAVSSDDTDGAASGIHGVTGSLFALAPEQLAGGPVDARTDLFALGALLHELLIGRRTGAREFYARFPEQSFFEATSTSVSDLPGWARDVVARLLAREPHARPRSAAQVGRTLAGRLGLELAEGGASPGLSLRWPPEGGREAALASWITALAGELCRAAEGGSAARRPASLHWWSVPEGEDPRPLAGALRTRLALEGCATRTIDLERSLRALRSVSDLAAWASRVAEERPAGVVIAALSSGEPVALRALDVLARTIAQRNEAGPAGEQQVLVALSGSAPLGAGLAWSHLVVPPVDERQIAALLERELEEEVADRIALFAARLARESAGSATRVDRLLRHAVEAGQIVWGRERPRLRPGPLSERIAAAGQDGAPRRALPVELGLEARVALAALHVAGGRAGFEELRDLTGSSRQGAAVEALVAAGLVIAEARSDGVELELDSAGFDLDALGLDEARWRELHARRARQLRRAQASAATVLVHEYAADPGLAALARVRDEAESLRERGLAELALDLCSRLDLAARERGGAPDPRITAELALSWAALGEPDRALAALRAIETETEPGIAAIVERVRGQVASLRHDLDRALVHFERAAILDPEDSADAIFGRARLYFESRRDRELEDLDARARAGEFGPLAGRVLGNLANLVGMSRFRRGEVETARAAFEAALEDARREGNALRESGIRLNLATIARRTGDVEGAIAEVRRAIALYEAEGLLPGLAQAQALLGGTLREQGEFGEAESLLVSALAIRERLGDQAGATAVRGMLGLCHADRGHARPALEELARSAATLRAAGRSIDAAVLEARVDELRARVGPPRPRPRAKAGEQPAADPRILVARARAEWLAGDVPAASEFAERARSLSERLSLAAPLAEARLLQSWLVHWQRARAGEATPRPISPGELEGAPLVKDDARVLALLAEDLSREGSAREARSFAVRLCEQGRDDRAARLFFALQARSGDLELARAALLDAEAAFRRCAIGLDPDATLRLRRALLGIPDPWPLDLEARADRSRDEGEWDMDVARLLEINHRLVQQEDLDTLLGAIVESALAVTGAERGFVILEEDGELRFDTALDSRRGGIAAPDLEVSTSILRQALGLQRPLRLSNAVDDPLLGGAPSVSALDLRSILCAPFEVEPEAGGQGLRGVIYLDHRLRAGAFNERAEELLVLLADQATLAIRQVRRLAEIKRLNRELEGEVAHKESDLRTARAVLREVQVPRPPSGLVGSGAAIRAVHALLERSAQAHLPVLVTGESGTGKELAARALHSLSARASGPFVSENCAALPATLIEAELFGTKKGAYTGADRDRAGLFERADGGTLFLDEIGDLALDLQAKLLRVLETGEVRRLGDSRPRAVDFRLVAATHHDLEGDVAEGRFRADLFYRLDGLRVRMPPLSERVEDLPELVDHFVRLEAARTGRPRAIAPAVLARLCRRPWPGNVRELANEVARLCVLSEGDVVDPELVRPPSLAGAREPSGPLATLAEIERDAIERALAAEGGDKRKAAQRLGISRAKIYQRIKEWRLEEAGTRDPEAEPEPSSSEEEQA